jgi:hypothetical protein
MYLEYHIVYLLVGIGPPLPQASVYPPPPNQRGGHARLRVRAGEKAWHSVYSV